MSDCKQGRDERKTGKETKKRRWGWREIWDLCSQCPERAVWKRGVETKAEKRVRTGNTGKLNSSLLGWWLKCPPGLMCLSLGQALRISRLIPWPALSPSFPLSTHPLSLSLLHVPPVYGWKLWQASSLLFLFPAIPFPPWWTPSLWDQKSKQLFHLYVALGLGIYHSKKQ